MKLSFVLKKQGRLVATTDEIYPPERAQFAQRICNNIQEDIGDLECAVDAETSFLEIAIDVGERMFSWKISGACCEAFSDMMHERVLTTIVHQSHPPTARV